MNDEPQDDGPHNDGPDDAHIRALLADLGSGPRGESMPPEVAARLDATLARLVAERDAASSTTPDPEPETSPLVPLRRRRLSRMTAAAAAVVVLGAGGVAATSLGLLDGSGGASSDSASSEAGTSSDRSTAKSLQGDSAPSTGPSSDASHPVGPLPHLGASSFARDVKTLLLQGSDLLTPEEARAGAPGSTTQSPRAGNRDQAGREASGLLQALGCPGPKITGTSQAQPVVMNDQLAVLVLHPERGGKRLVEAWTCDGERRLVAATLKP